MDRLFYSTAEYLIAEDRLCCEVMVHLGKCTSHADKFLTDWVRWHILSDGCWCWESDSLTDADDEQSSLFLTLSLSVSPESSALLSPRSGCRVDTIWTDTV